MSVRAVVETTLHDSDLCPAGSAMRRMREGTVAHRARQSAAQEEERVYRAEVALHASYRTPELVLRVSGRADGILTGEDGAVIIEEIKLGMADAPLLPAHRAQAAFYGHMLCQQEGLEGVRLRVVYVDIGGAVLRSYEEEMSALSLHALFDELCAPAARAARKDVLPDALSAGGVSGLPCSAHRHHARELDAHPGGHRRRARGTGALRQPVSRHSAGNSPLMRMGHSLRAGRIFPAPAKPRHTKSGTCLRGKRQTGSGFLLIFF